jgi:hypothetical protein
MKTQLDTQRLVSILLIASFVVMILTMPFGVPGYYQTQDVGERLQRVAQYRTRWDISKSLLYLWSILSVAGAVALAIYLQRKGASMMAAFAALLFALGSFAYFLVNYTQQFDLAGYLAGKYPDYHVYGNWLVLAGLLLFGLAFLQTDVAPWLSYLTIGAAFVPAVVLLIQPGLFWLIPFFPYEPLLLLIGIVLLRQQSPANLALG